MMTSTLTKAELADLLFEKVGLNKREAKDMVEAFFEEIRFSSIFGRMCGFVYRCMFEIVVIR